MPVVMSARAAENSDTQLHTIRDLMLSASQRGAWMTLGEIAGLTEIGEASISAQLRHLRKSRHGRHRVEKRRRIELFRDGRRETVAAEFTRRERRDVRRRESAAAVIWKYRVLPPAAWETTAIARRRDEAARVLPSTSRSTESPSDVQSSGTEESRCVEKGQSELESNEDGAGSLARSASEVSDAEACN